VSLSNFEAEITNSFVTFYDQVKQVPVSQFDSGSTEHEIRRKRLFASLGVSPNTVKGSRILEIGPGGGSNAEIILRWLPEKLTLLDGSLTAISQLQSRFQDEKVEIILGDFLTNLPNEFFDIIIAEGCVPGQKNPSRLVSSLSQRLAVNGQLIITTQTSISLLSEILRRIIAIVLIDKKQDKFEENISVLSEYFKPSLNSLEGMSRPVRDWVIDVLIHPWEVGNHLFSPIDALAAVGKDFDIIATRPNTFLNQEWYKTDVKEKSVMTEGIEKNFQIESCLLLDYRQSEWAGEGFDKDQADLLQSLCNAVYKLHCTTQVYDSTHVFELLDLLNRILETIEGNFPSAHESLKDFALNFERFVEFPQKQYFSSFHNWFGRGQQYLSLMRLK